jgi:hypothetical protein
MDTNCNLALSEVAQLSPQPEEQSEDESSRLLDALIKGAITQQGEK